MPFSTKWKCTHVAFIAVQRQFIINIYIYVAPSQHIQMDVERLMNSLSHSLTSRVLAPSHSHNMQTAKFMEHNICTYNMCNNIHSFIHLYIHIYIHADMCNVNLCKNHNCLWCLNILINFDITITIYPISALLAFWLMYDVIRELDSPTLYIMQCCCCCCGHNSVVWKLIKCSCVLL